MARGTGSNVHIEMGSTPITAAPFTLSAWFKIDDLSHVGAILGVGNGGSGNDVWGLDAAGTVEGDPLRFFSFDTSFSSADSTIAYTANVWHHACGVEASATSRAVYLDGGSKGTNADNRTPDGANEVQIGQYARSTGDGDLIGDVAEAAIWNVALTDAEVAILAKGYSPLFVRPESLIFYMPLVRDIYDVIGAIGFTDFSTTITDHPPIIYPGRSTIGIASPPAGGVTVTPPTLALVLTTFAPTVATPVVATPPVLALITSAFAPSAVIGTVISVPTATLTTSTFAPVIKLAVIPPTQPLTLTAFTPVVTVSGAVVVTVPTATLTLATFAPTATAPRLVTPGVLALTLSTFIPIVSTPRVVTPGVIALSLSTFAPTVTVGADVTVTPGVIALTLTTFASTVTLPSTAPTRRVFVRGPDLHRVRPDRAVMTFWAEARMSLVMGVKIEAVATFSGVFDSKMGHGMRGELMSGSLLELVAGTEDGLARLQGEVKEGLEREREAEEEVLLGLR